MSFFLSKFVVSWKGTVGLSPRGWWSRVTVSGRSRSSRYYGCMVCEKKGTRKMCYRKRLFDWLLVGTNLVPWIIPGSFFGPLLTSRKVHIIGRWLSTGSLLLTIETQVHTVQSGSSWILIGKLTKWVVVNSDKKIIKVSVTRQPLRRRTVQTKEDLRKRVLCGDGKPNFSTYRIAFLDRFSVHQDKSLQTESVHLTPFNKLKRLRVKTIDLLPSI